MSALTEAGSTPSLSPANFPPLLKVLREHFASRETTAFLVGGAVRDALLGRETSDFDLVVDHDTPVLGAELAGILGGRSITLDEARGIVRVVVSGDDAGAVVDLKPLGDDGIRGDLSRRDFTVDAMAAPVFERHSDDDGPVLIDPYDGTADLRAGVIRAVSPSVFEADPARLMRAPRLAAQLGFEIADETADSIRRHAELVTGVASERVRDELLNLLAQPSVATWLRLLDDLGLLCLVIPELAEGRGVTQPKEHNWDVFNHCIETAGQVERVFSPAASEDDRLVAESLPRFDRMEEYFSEEASDGHTRLTMLKLAGLLHDIAKPATRTVETSGRIRFLGHHHVGAEMSEQVLSRLRLSRDGIDLVGRMVEHHLRPSQMAQGGEMPTARAVYRYYRDVGDAAIDTLYLNMADYLAARGPMLGRDEWAAHCQVIGHILREGLAPKAPQRLTKLIDGHDIIETLGLTPGPRIGVLLELVREAQASGEIASREEAMQMVRSRLSSGGDSA